MSRAKTRVRLRGSNRAQTILDLLDQCCSWKPFFGPTGALLWRVPGSSNNVYTVSATSCTCPADQHVAGRPCKHRAALATYLKMISGYRLHTQALARGAAYHEHKRSANDE